MNRILVTILSMIAVPIFLYMRGKSGKNLDQQEYKQNHYSQPSFNSYDKTNELKYFLDNVPSKVKKEIEEFRNNIQRLRAEGRSLYNHLSNGAKEAIQKEHEYWEMLKK